MTTLLEDPTFVFMWIGFLVLMSVGTAVFFLWAIRAEQFSQQDQARYLALQTPAEAGPAPDDPGLPQLNPRPPGEGARRAGEGVSLQAIPPEPPEAPGSQP